MWVNYYDTKICKNVITYSAHQEPCGACPVHSPSQSLHCVGPSCSGTVGQALMLLKGAPRMKGLEPGKKHYKHDNMGSAGRSPGPDVGKTQGQKP